MHDKNEVVAIIPARAGSKRVPGKNTREFQGQPLIVWSINAALECPLISRVIISTNDSVIVDIAKSYDVEIVERSEELSTDTASTFDALKHVYYDYLLQKSIYPTFIVLLQPTSPLREKNLIEIGLEKINNDKNADSLVEVNKLVIGPGEIVNGYYKNKLPEETRSQDIEPIIFPSGRLYIYRCKNTIEKNSALGRNTLPILADYERNINIDYESDFDKLEYVYKKNKNIYSYLVK